MKTVKEVSILTGISVRTLHYYDEIGLFKPTEVSDAGYRLYDDKALEKLHQILIFKELDLPLSDIRIIMEHPGLDHKSILERQRKLLELKRERLGRIIASIDEMLKGDQEMDFTVFDAKEMKLMVADMLANMNEEQKQIAERLIAILVEKGYEVATKVTPASVFWRAEEYHQDYFEHNEGEPDCHFYTKRF